MKNYKINDKVKIRSDLVIGKKYGADIFTESMSKWRGKEVLIKKLLPNNCFNIYGSFFIFTYDMIKSNKIINIF